MLVFYSKYLFFLFPNLLIDYLHQGLIFSPYKPGGGNYFPNFYLREFLYVEDLMILAYFRIISILSMTILTLIIIIKQQLEIERKFGYFSIILLFLDTYNSLALLIMNLPLCTLLFIKYFEPCEKLKDLLLNNWNLLLGLISISGIMMMFTAETIFNFLPFLKEFPFVIIVNLRWIILLSIMVSSLLILYFKSKF